MVGLAQLQNPNSGISHVLYVDALFGFENAQELFLGLSLITKAK